MVTAWVKVPLVTMSPVASGELTGSRTSSRRDGAAQTAGVEHIGGMAAIDHGAIAQQLDLEPCEIGHPIGRAAEAGRMAWREQQRAVQDH